MEAIASPLLAATDPSVERVEGIIHVLQHVNISKVSILAERLYELDGLV